MTTYLKSNDNQLSNAADGRVFLPLPPENSEDSHAEMEIYARFMRHLRIVPNSAIEIKLLSAIQFTADLLNESDAYVSKVLVDLGLRAPRKAFPGSYLTFIDKSAMRSGKEAGSPTLGAQEILKHWHRIGEDKFVSVKRDYAVAEETYFVET